MKNKLAYLGFLGFLGVLGCFTEPILLCYFSFFIFFLYARVIPDELFWMNIRKSATIGFFIFLISATIIVAFGVAFADKAPDSINRIVLTGLGLTIAISHLAFLISMQYFEIKEKSGKQSDE